MLSQCQSLNRRRQWHPTPVLLPGKSHGRRSLVGCSPWSREESDTTERLHFHFSLLCIGEGNGNPLQCSCLENPRDGGAWWAAVSGVSQSQTRLKWLSSSSSSSHLYVFLFQVFWLFFDWVIYYFDTQLYELSSGHVWMWELDCKESWVLKNWCFWIVVLEKTLASPLDCKEIQAVHPKGDQSWVFIGRTDAEAETPILWPPHGKSWLIGKDSDAGRVWGQEEKGTTEDGWMASPTRWTWISVNSGSWWWTGRPGVLRFMGSQRVGHDWVTELNWTVWAIYIHAVYITLSFSRKLSLDGLY